MRTGLKDHHVRRYDISCWDMGTTSKSWNPDRIGENVATLQWDFSCFCPPYRQIQHILYSKQVCQTCGVKYVLPCPMSYGAFACAQIKKSPTVDIEYAVRFLRFWHVSGSEDRRVETGGVLNVPVR